MYFDNAATSYPKPEMVYATMDRFIRTAGANPGRSGHRMALDADVAIARARQSLARLLNAPHPERLVWTANGTTAINLALKGLLRAGDHVVHGPASSTMQWPGRSGRLKRGVWRSRASPAPAAPSISRSSSVRSGRTLAWSPSSTPVT